jgi:ABC-type sulfate transport system permease component
MSGGVARTLSIAIYDSVQSFDMPTASGYSLALLIISLLALVMVRLNHNPSLRSSQSPGSQRSR